MSYKRSVLLNSKQFVDLSHFEIMKKIFLKTVNDD